MGYFLAVSAFRGVPVDALARAVEDFATRYRVRSDLAVSRGVDLDPHVDSTIYDPVNDWTLILWPEYFNTHDFETCKELSVALGCLVSTIHVYDDDYWAHALIDRGLLVDRFCSYPTYFTEDGADESAIRAKWIGHPELVSDKVGVPPESIRGYFVDVSGLTEAPPPRPSGLFGFLKKQPQRPAPEPGKVDPTDEFDLQNFWVFTDFWRKLGIQYPDDMNSWTIRLRFASGFGGQFPSGDDEL